MKKLKITLFFGAALLLSALAAGTETLDYIVIDDALVADKLLPAGTEVKVRVERIPDQFNTSISLICYPESVFNPGRPGNVGYRLKTWLAVDILPGDVLSYTTDRRCFIGYAANPDYRDLRIDRPQDGFRHLNFSDWYGHRWVIGVRLPDYEY